jgi:dTDP-4-dehydrorhamnose 3,5-epimerase
VVSIVGLSTEVTDIDGLVVVTMKQVTDERGTIREFYRESAFVAAGLPSLGPWVQVNVTETGRGAVRGMHGEAMTKLVSVAAGRAHGAYIDARRGSATFGVVVQIDLVPGVQVLVPPGVCNGFQALEDGTQFLYCFDVEWQPGMAGVACTPLDPALGIDWPIAVDPDDAAQVSAKDRSAPRFAELP